MVPADFLGSLPSSILLRAFVICSLILKHSSGPFHEATFLSANILAQLSHKMGTKNVFPFAATTTLDGLLKNTHVQNSSPLAFIADFLLDAAGTTIKIWGM